MSQGRGAPRSWKKQEGPPARASGGAWAADTQVQTSGFRAGPGGVSAVISSHTPLSQAPRWLLSWEFAWDSGPGPLFPHRDLA